MGERGRFSGRPINSRRGHGFRGAGRGFVTRGGMNGNDDGSGGHFSRGMGRGFRGRGDFRGRGELNGRVMGRGMYPMARGIPGPSAGRILARGAFNAPRGRGHDGGSFRGSPRGGIGLRILRQPPRPSVRRENPSTSMSPPAKRRHWDGNAMFNEPQNERYNNSDSGTNRLMGNNNNNDVQPHNYGGNDYPMQTNNGYNSNPNFARRGGYGSDSGYRYSKMAESGHEGYPSNATNNFGSTFPGNASSAYNSAGRYPDGGGGGNAGFNTPDGNYNNYGFNNSAGGSYPNNYGQGAAAQAGGGDRYNFDNYGNPSYSQSRECFAAPGGLPPQHGGGQQHSFRF